MCGPRLSGEMVFALYAAGRACPAPTWRQEGIGRFGQGAGEGFIPPLRCKKAPRLIGGERRDAYLSLYAGL